MENFIGVIIFILFIALRAMSDRSKGMSKKAVPPKAKETVSPVAAPAKKQPRTAKPAMSGPLTRGAAPVFKQAAVPKAKQVAVAPVRQTEIISLGEGEGGYGSLPYLEDAGQLETAAEQQPQVDAGIYEQEEDVVNGYGLAAVDLSQAIIWSEIIEKPRFKKKCIR